jgi:radical SAM superfamily enzyme YgiQ (UPF0313 family)
MNITLVNPPYPPNAHAHPPFIPLGIGYLGAVCEKNGYNVNVIDCQAEKLSLDAFRKRVAQTDADVVGMTSTTLTYKSALKVASIAKEVLPQCTTILGGCHATFWDENALKECPSIDIIVRREGELTFLELLQKLKDGKSLGNIKGVTFRKADGQIVRNEDRPFIENLDDLPFPAHHLLPLNAFHRMGKTIFPLTTSRGCVYWCDFCTAVRMFGRKYRMRSPKNVVDEIESLCSKYGATQFTFYDDAFTVDPVRVEKICEEIRRRKLRIQWDCETRVDMVDRALLQKMKDAGCIAVWFGVESGSQQIIEKMHKKIKLDQTRNAYKTAREVGLMTVASVVLGFPGETEQTAWETINFVKELNPDDIGFYIATPYPGTPMYDLIKEKGWLRVTDFDRYDTATPTFETPYLSMEKLREIRYKAHQQFYLRPMYILHMMSRGGTYGISAVKTSLAYAVRALHLRLS